MVLIVLGLVIKLRERDKIVLDVELDVVVLSFVSVMDVVIGVVVDELVVVVAGEVDVDVVVELVVVNVLELVSISLKLKIIKKLINGSTVVAAETK